jgi:hypothetical protein
VILFWRRSTNFSSGVECIKSFVNGKTVYNPTVLGNPETPTYAALSKIPSPENELHKKLLDTAIEIAKRDG